MSFAQIAAVQEGCDLCAGAGGVGVETTAAHTGGDAALDGAADAVAAAVLAEAGPAPLAPLLPALLARIAPRAVIRTIPLNDVS